MQGHRPVSPINSLPHSLLQDTFGKPTIQQDRLDPFRGPNQFIDGRMHEPLSSIEDGHLVGQSSDVINLVGREKDALGLAVNVGGAGGLMVKLTAVLHPAVSLVLLKAWTCTW